MVSQANNLLVLHATVKEFLELSGFEDTLLMYENELERKSIKPKGNLLPDPCEGEAETTKSILINKFLTGDTKEFWTLWKKSIPKSYLTDGSVERLEFLIQLYFAVYPMISNEHLLSPVEGSMNEFKQYLESNGAALSQTTEFVAYYALPYVPNPRNHPTFKILFEESWKEELRVKLTNFLGSIFNSDPIPYLYKIYTHFEETQNSEGPATSSAEDKETIDRLSAQVKSLEDLVKQNAQRADNYYHKSAKVQGDYHNLIGISAELVDSLEKCVRGQMITAEYLQNICERLFHQTSNGDETVNNIRPDTTGSFLRASIANEKDVIQQSTVEDYSTNLNFNQIQIDLTGTIPQRQKALLLQALIWRLTRSEAGPSRDTIISSYLNEDILGCTAKEIPEYVCTVFIQENIVSEYMARFINTVASFSYGRFYMSQSEGFVQFMVQVMIHCRTDSLTSENIIGGLQKLSLRRYVQTVLIDSAVIEWLLKTLDDPDNLSDYAIEYTAALLMNLCLRVSGKKKCCLHPEKVLKSLSDLLGYENEEIRPYLNGTLYSILSLPSIRSAARHMGLEEVLQLYLKDKNHDERQIKFIIKQMNTEDNNTDDDVISDDDDDDDDEEGDAVEAESEKEESIKAALGEKFGEELLATKYYLKAGFPSLSVSTSVSTKSKKSKLNKSLLDEPYTRPVTPAMKPGKAQSDTGSQRPIQPVATQERPRTSSSKGARKPQQEQATAKGSNRPTSGTARGKNFKQAFATRPKIPRTPESASSTRPPSSTDTPLPTRSISPPQSRKGSSRNSNRSTPR